jgi:hypothetical protein
MKLKILPVFAAWASLLAGSAVAANDPGFTRVEDAITLDAGTPVFHFTTFEILPGASVQFTGLETGDTLTLLASEAIRIWGAIDLTSASGLRLEAPVIEIGPGARLDLSGSTIALVGGAAGPRVTTPGSGMIALASGGDLSPDSPRYTAGSIAAGNTGPLFVEPEGAITLQAPVPEPRTWAMLGVGLGLVGFAAPRRKPAGQADLPRRAATVIAGA